MIFLIFQRDREMGGLQTTNFHQTNSESASPGEELPAASWAPGITKIAAPRQCEEMSWLKQQTPIQTK